MGIIEIKRAFPSGDNSTEWLTNDPVDSARGEFVDTHRGNQEVVVLRFFALLQDGVLFQSAESCESHNRSPPATQSKCHRPIFLGVVKLLCCRIFPHNPAYLPNTSVTVAPRLTRKYACSSAQYDRFRRQSVILFL